MTSIEDLSNEIFYEIIDYLDICDAYEGFYNLNHRFRCLFEQLTLPYKITIDCISKAKFQRCYQSIIIPNSHRILSLCISNWLCLTKFSFDSSFIQLESLTLHDIKSKKLPEILMNLTLLPHLFSLSLTTIGLINDSNTIHRLLFSLPVLKYCNTTFQWSNDLYLIPKSINTISPIQYFISKSIYYLKHLHIILSCMPQLIHLSCSGNSALRYQPQWTSIVCPKLTYLHLDHSISFLHFELLMSNFIHHLEILRLTLQHDSDYLDSKRWEQLIVNHLPCLHTFDLQYIGKVLTTQDEYSLLIDGFISSFWIERKWFFHHEFYFFKNVLWLFFYSVQQTYSNEQINFRFLRHFHIENDETTVDLCSSQMMISNTNSTVLTLSMNKLNEIISFEYVKKLILKTNDVNTKQLMNLLSFCPNTQILVLSTYISGCLSSYQNNNNNNNIQKLLIHQRLSLVDIKEIMIAYPCLKSLEIKIKEYDLELIVRFILKYIMNQYSPLHLLSFQETHPVMINRLQKVIEREELLENYSIEDILDTAYLWW